MTCVKVCVKYVKVCVNCVIACEQCVNCAKVCLNCVKVCMIYAKVCVYCVIACEQCVNCVKVCVNYAKVCVNCVKVCVVYQLYLNAHAQDCALIRMSRYVVAGVWWNITVATTEKWKMTMATQFSLESFNPSAESIEGYKERFDFYCTAHQIPEARRKALFLTRIGRNAFAKLKTLVNPTPLNDVALSDIVTTMMQHYKKDTVEIAERFKFFKRRKSQLQIT